MIYYYELQRLVSQPLTGWKRASRLSCHKLGSLNRIVASTKYADDEHNNALHIPESPECAPPQEEFMLRANRSIVSHKKNHRSQAILSKNSPVEFFKSWN